MVRRWRRELEPVNHLKNLGHPDHCVFLLRTQSQGTHVLSSFCAVLFFSRITAVLSGKRGDTSGVRPSYFAAEPSHGGVAASESP